jgi:hypothetical protein
MRHFGAFDFDCYDNFVIMMKKIFFLKFFSFFRKDRGVIFSTIPNHNPFYVLFRFLLIDHHNKITKNEKINF